MNQEKISGFTPKLDVRSMRARAEAMRDRIISFWRERSEDKEFGGFLTNFDSAGNDLGTPEKYLNTQCRLIWTFSALLRNGKSTEYEYLARQGVDFLIAHFWDEKYEGFYWKCNRDGSCLDDGKIVYGESFAIYALSEYYIATQDKRGLDYAIKTYDALRKYSSESTRGGYREYFNRDWTLELPGFGGGDRKTLDTHMHLLESFTVLYEASHLEEHRQKLKELLELIYAKMIDHQRGSGLNQFDFEWNSVPALSLKRTWNAERFGEQPADPTQTTSYGHNTELVWLMNRAIEIGGFDLEFYKPIMKRLLDHAIEHGIDWEFGGVFRDGQRETGEPIILEKEFWQNAEIVVGMLDGYSIFNDEIYWKAFENVWNFNEKYFVIPEVGEWNTLLSREGGVLDGNIGNPWKVSYHTGRSSMECVTRLAKLDKCHSTVNQ